MESSVEVIYHFTCAECKNWWSVAMEKTGWNPWKIWCPHCGHKQEDRNADTFRKGE